VGEEDELHEVVGFDNSIRSKTVRVLSEGNRTRGVEDHDFQQRLDRGADEEVSESLPLFTIGQGDCRAVTKDGLPHEIGELRQFVSAKYRRILGNY